MGHFAYEPLIKEIKGRLSITNLVETYVSLKKSGRGHVGLCPFHDEKTPSFHVNEEKGIFHCFGCGAGGDIFGFMMRYKSLTFAEALRELAKRAQVKLEENHAPPQKKSRKDVLFKVNALVSHFYHKLLMESKGGKAARDYLGRRQIPLETAEEFQLGYAPPGWDGLVKFLADKKVPIVAAEKVGLVVRRKTDGYYDRFRERLIFPIHDIEGKVVGFGGRTLVDEEPKYLNSPESEIYHKRGVLYGLNKSREFIRKKGQAVLVEGYTDFLAVYMSGVKNVVATLGTSFSQEHAKLLRRYTDRVVVVFDADESGVRAAVRVLEIFLKEGILPFMAVLPEGNDPHSFISEGNSDEFSRLVKDAVPLLDFFIETAKRDFQKGESSRNGAVQSVAEVLTKIKDPIERSHYVKKTAEDFGVREAEVLSLVKYREKGEEGVKVEPKKSPETQEKIILKILLKFPECGAYLKGKGAIDFIPEGEIRSVIEDMVFNGFEDASSLLLRFRSSPAQEIISEAVLFSHDIADRPTAMKMLIECIKKLELRELENRLKVLRIEIEQASRERDEDLEKNLVGKYKDLKEREKKVKGEMYER